MVDMLRGIAISLCVFACLCLAAAQIKDAAQSDAFFDSDGNSNENSSDVVADEKRFTVPQKAFGMGLVNWKPEVVAAALQRAVNKDRPFLIERGLVFYTLIKKKRGEGIDKEGVANVLEQAIDILVGKGYDRGHVESIIFKVDF